MKRLIVLVFGSAAAAVLAFSTGACSSSSPSAGGTDAGPETAANSDGAVDAGEDVYSRCGHPGDQGNSLGVGKFCNTFSDCATTPAAHICSIIGDPTTHVCTIAGCTPPPDGGADGGDAGNDDAGTSCGENTYCGCNSGGSCGCVPKSC